MFLIKFLKILVIFFPSLLFANDFEPLQKGKIEFDTYYTFDYSRLYSEEFLKSPLKGRGTLSLPKEISELDKAPLVIILHTSGGIKSHRESMYAKFLNKEGFATFVVDTYGTRKCNASGAGWKNCISKISTLDFATDAYASLDVLKSHPNLDMNRTALIGFSMGGDAAMQSLNKDIKDIFSPTTPSFKSVISVYGACNNKYDISKTIGSDFHYIVGSNDISYVKEYCDQRYSELEKAGTTSNEYIIEGAVHGYDANFPIQLIPTSEIPNMFNCQFEFYRDGTVIEAITGNKVKLDSTDDLKEKFKIRKNFAFKEIKDCYGKNGLKMGSQPSAVNKTKDLFKSILSLI